MTDGLVWVQPEEHEQIVRMRTALQDELAAALPELGHDHQFVRFLRGHGGFGKVRAMCALLQNAPACTLQSCVPRRSRRCDSRCGTARSSLPPNRFAPCVPRPRRPPRSTSRCCHTLTRCIGTALALHVLCTRAARALHVLCTRAACALHVGCMWAVCGLYVRCGPVRDSAPPNGKVLPHLPLRAVEGATVDGLPVCLSVTRLFHFGALTDGTVDAAG